MSKLRELALGHIILSDLPLSAFDGPFLQELLRQFDPSLARDLYLGRATMASQLHQLFKAKKEVVKAEIGQALTLIHFSFDLWTSPNQRAFISVFSHFLNAEGIYKSRIIAFEHVSEAHSGENIAQILEVIAKDWSFAHKVGVGVCDNALNNDTCLKALFDRLDPFMEDKYIAARRLRCFGHILNLTAQAFLFGSDGAFELEVDALEQSQQYDEARARWRRKGPVGKLHNIVKFIRASPQRIEALKAAAKDLEEGPYSLTEESTAELQLRQNNSTRWNSTYLMIDRAYKKRPEIDLFLARLDHSAPRAQRLPAEDRLTSGDWQLLGEIRNILEPLYELTIETQGWPTTGQLHLVMTGMEYILTHFEAWKEIYSDPTAKAIKATASLEPLQPQPSRRSVRRRQQRESRNERIFQEDALPLHTRQQYITIRESSVLKEMEPDERSHMRACLNNAWLKLVEYYSALGDSPLYAAALILHPKYNLAYLQRIWRDDEQLPWVKEAEDGLRDYFDRWYPSSESPQADKSTPAATSKAGMATVAKMIPQLQERPHREPSKFQSFVDASLSHDTTGGPKELDRYLRLESQNVDDPVAWWRTHMDEFPRLSKLALDILAIPAMASDCERAFSLAKLIMTSQRIRMNDLTLGELMMLKNWVLHSAVSLGDLQL